MQLFLANGQPKNDYLRGSAMKTERPHNDSGPPSPDLLDPLVPPDADLRSMPYMPLYCPRPLHFSFHGQVSNSEWRAPLTCSLAVFGRKLDKDMKVKVEAVKKAPAPVIIHQALSAPGRFHGGRGVKR